MARTRAPDRFPQLIDAAARSFIRCGGYRRTQIADVAQAMGVAKGTIYLYAQSKDALFDLALRHADAPGQPAPELPVPEPAPGATLEFIRAALAEASFPALTAAESRKAPSPDMETELAGVVEELYDTLAAHRWTIGLINASAPDLPELAELWFGQARRGLNARLAVWLQRRADAGFLRPIGPGEALPSAEAAARLLTEAAHWFAVRRGFDPQPDGFDDAAARATTRAAALHTLLPS